MDIQEYYIHFNKQRGRGEHDSVETCIEKLTRRDVLNNGILDSKKRTQLRFHPDKGGKPGEFDDVMTCYDKVQKSLFDNVNRDARHNAMEARRKSAEVRQAKQQKETLSKTRARRESKEAREARAKEAEDDFIFDFDDMKL